MKKIIPTLVICLVVCSSILAQEDQFVVQVGAFESKVDMNYFKGLDVFYSKDHNDIHKYFLGDFESMAVAKQKAKEVRKMGFNTRTLNLGAIQRNCAMGCFAPEEEVVVDIKLKSIFFDFDRSVLRKESKRQLDLLYSLLTDHPDYNAELNAHTDAKGSDRYNQKLSLRRAQAAKRYLMNRGISDSRIMVSVFGEENPIAINELKGGIDSEAGRQYNRRVELAVYRADGKLTDVVEEIYVPEKLKPELFARKN